MAVTAPHVSRNPPNPAPNPEAKRKATSRSNPSSGPTAANTACAQEYPRVNNSTARSAADTSISSSPNGQYAESKTAQQGMIKDITRIKDQRGLTHKRINPRPIKFAIA